MEKKHELETQIENLRERLYQLSKQNAKEKELLEVSQLLDVTLNEYDRRNSK
ncbi:aspartyl-phosphate phosphatase Spo0E family protein [Aquibacillus koreensis]|uniref:Aspartyl-phosphate phosphatase Spo0E family protein n=1 Tax=Aquibacillus koreensis TaxID=279446 RepID=A0A9X3WNT6_9BACI|nr:aspartyl-phosphate phosphatase Spo0E family protein [Aquibacillus koreensis]MCT2534251.1 aspartyl-phosphate phosphatase Spo0E family protein [Aquibacillus koreensis]MDC3420704.1 aspartyl-phosphate phosphatase Spo0E family protein [Aquibacillus koreensis]